MCACSSTNATDPSWSSKALVMILSRKMLKRVGDSRHLCLTPIAILNLSPTVPYCADGFAVEALYGIMELWPISRHLALGLGGPGSESWLCQVDVESLGKTLYMHFHTPWICKMRTRL